MNPKVRELAEKADFVFWQDEAWTLDQIVEEYEKTNSKIRWFEK
jgi:hypothetical protein